MKNKINQIVILNGGIGSRVKSISNSAPKCLIKINNQTFLYRQLKLIKKNNIKNIVICCGYKSQMIIQEIKKEKIKNLKLNIRISTEKKMLGTGGAILNSYKYLNNHFFVIYGDSWLDIKFNKVAKKIINSKKDGLMTIIKSSLVKDHNPNLSVINNQIIAYKKNSKNINFKFIDYGLIVLKKKILANFKKKYRKNKFDLNNIIKSMIVTKDLASYNVNNRFYTIGTPYDIKKIEKVIK